MKVGAFTIVRVIVMLRRIWQSIDKLADIEQSRLDLDRDRMALDHPRWEQAGGKLPAKPKKATFDVAQVDDWNKAHKATHPEEEY